MRKADREVTDIEEKLAALLRCEFLTLALRGEGAPYCVPLNFGAELVGERLVLYFHCAREGVKLEKLAADGRVGFSAARLLRVFNKGVAPCGYTADYESVCGEGNRPPAHGGRRAPARPVRFDGALYGRTVRGGRLSATPAVADRRRARRRVRVDVQAPRARVERAPSAGSAAPPRPPASPSKKNFFRKKVTKTGSILPVFCVKIQQKEGALNIFLRKKGAAAVRRPPKAEKINS